MPDKHPTAPRGHTVSTGWPAWRYGPGGESQVFQAEVDVPEGWADHPSKAVTPVVMVTVAAADYEEIMAAPATPIPPRPTRGNRPPITRLQRTEE